MARHLQFQIDARFDGKKIRDYLKSEAKVSHRMLCILKRTPCGITVNGAHARTIDILHTGDILALSLPNDEVSVTPTPTDIPLAILYMDDDLIIVNKQAGLAMHETHNHQGDALSNALAYYLTQHGEPAVFRAVGRLDKGTSGIVVCARNKYCAARLSGQIQKTYFAVAGGVFTSRTGKRFARTASAPYCGFIWKRDARTKSACILHISAHRLSAMICTAVQIYGLHTKHCTAGNAGLHIP